jgi:proline iminopeptidase
MAEDVVSVARSMGLDRYAVLGHSYGAFVALQNAVDFPNMAAQTIVSSGVPSAKYLADIEKQLASFEPVHLREQIAASWEKESSVQTAEEFAELMTEQWPFHFANPEDPRIEEYDRKTTGSVLSPEVLQQFASNDYGAIEVEPRLGEVSQPVLVLAGRHDRVCSAKAAEATAKGIPGAELVIFEHSAHMTFVEEQDAYLDAVDGFLSRSRR